MLSFLPEHHDDRRDPGPIENIRRQTDDRIDMVIFDQIFADFSFFSSSEQDSVRKYDRHDPIRFYMEQVMQQECIICLALRCNSKTGISRIILLIGRIPCL